ncbi:RDD family protein [bacterium]|nr:RDD family protein [bacterium]
MKYAGFWKRFCALIVDAIIMSPIFFISSRFAHKSLHGYIATTIFGLFAYIIFQIIFVKFWGGSPGKLAVKIKIVKLNGSNVLWREAILRSIVDLMFILLIDFIIIYTLSKSNITWGSYTFQVFRKYYKTLLPSYYKTIEILRQIWFWSELIVLLFNKKKRALHDFIAGTVVIRKETQPTI